MRQSAVQYYVVRGGIIIDPKPQVYNVFHNQIALASNSRVEVDEHGEKKFVVTCTCRI